MPTFNKNPIIGDNTADTLNNVRAILCFLQDWAAAVDFHQRPMAPKSAVGLGCILECTERALEHEVSTATMTQGKGI